MVRWWPPTGPLWRRGNIWAVSTSSRPRIWMPRWSGRPRLPRRSGSRSRSGHSPPPRPDRVGEGDAAATLDQVGRIFREESGRSVATLIRVVGDIDLAEDAVQEAFAVALHRWPV